MGEVVGERRDPGPHPCLVIGMSRIQNPITSIDWRASLVPAAAVIPAPIAYIKVRSFSRLDAEPCLAAFELAGERVSLLA